MTINAFEFDANHDGVHELHTSLTSLANALTDHHHNTTPESAFTLKPTSNTTYVSHSDDEGLSSDEVGRLLGSDLTPWAIDWMELSFPVKNIAIEPPFPWAELHSNGAKWNHIWQTTFEIGQGIVDLKITKKGNSLSGYLKFNPTTCMYGPKSLYVVRLDDALYVAGLVLDAVNEWVTPECQRHEMLLSRIDVNVTVEPVADIQRVLSIAKNSSTPRATSISSYGKNGRIETVVARSKRSGGFCIYDKGLQAGLKRSAIRFEVNARRSRLRELCPTLGDLTEDVLRKIALKSLQPVINQLELIPRNAVSDILAIQKEGTAFIEMVGLATLADLGHHPEVSTYAMRKKYKPIMRKYSARTVGDLLN
jgi:hypothetical protein